MRGLLLVSVMLAIFLLFSGCLDTQQIKTQDDRVLANMASSEKLLGFEEQARLSSFEQNYRNYSDEISSACKELDTLDSGKTRWSKETASACENKKGLDDCFFQIEKIKTQIKNGDTDINIGSLDVLCRDLRSMGMQDNLDTFEKSYKAYAAWLAAEGGISAKWDELNASFSNSSSGSEMKGAKVSDYYRGFKDSLSKAQVLLSDIKGGCALKGDFSATSEKVKKICSSVDGYISDLGKADAIATDAFDFIGRFESGSITIDSEFGRNCSRVSDEYSGLYELQLVKDTTPPNANKTGISEMCSTFENLSAIYGKLGIPLVLEGGALSQATKTEVFKAKTVYVETSTKVGSGVIISSDDTGYYILTNAHVALEIDPDTGSKYMPQYVHVKFYGGRTGYADKLAYDKEGYDFVILHVPSSGYYPSASFDPAYAPGDGDKVVAVGNPYGLQFSVTQGTVSGRRDFGCQDDYCYGYVIQTDTSINPGNSGGGLWDYDSGGLLGINSLGLSQAEGLNFAISMYQYDMIKDTFIWHTMD